MGGAPDSKNAVPAVPNFARMARGMLAARGQNGDVA